jgi:hypothetical protein
MILAILTATALLTLTAGIPFLTYCDRIRNRAR